MSLQPSLRPQIVIGAPDAPHTLDIFLDYVCPYSAKTALKIEKILKPLLGPGTPCAGKVKVIFRIHPQPWHAVSTLTSEAGLAVLRVSPENFWPFSLELFKHQEEYFDIPTQDLTIRQIRQKLAALAATVIPASAVDQFSDALAFKGAANGGNAVTDDLKYNLKFSRQNSIHVSPTVLWDGLIQHQVGSAWNEEEWSEFFAKQVTA
ncbi:hypothetical protein BDN70DRAFT_881701 [Pholiota conissans]|uniref:Thioredoxin-like fold domain-containing protein n=1 Tax=Pholiota conissans TaxID=109636 RepID=A0A9P5YWZ2_9AGAR|nr:hypothetical protein BDN70DRAFT_881701 [Pholiota conissans]